MNEHFPSLISKFITFLGAHVTRIYFSFDSILFSVNVRMRWRNRVVIKSESRAILRSFGFFMFGSLISMLFIVLFVPLMSEAILGKFMSRKGNAFCFMLMKMKRKIVGMVKGSILIIDGWKMEHKIHFLCEYFSNGFKVKC